MDILIRLVDVEYGTDILGRKNEYNLLFKGYVPRFDNSRLYYFKYNGIEIETTANLSDEGKKNLTEILNNDFKNAPFEIQKAKEILGDMKDYIICM